MNKSQLISAVAEKTSVPKGDVKRVFDALFDLTEQKLGEDEKVVISGFGTFEIRTRVARTGLNPRTGEEISIPQQKTPAFKTGKVLKEMVR